MNENNDKPKIEKTSAVKFWLAVLLMILAVTYFIIHAMNSMKQYEAQLQQYRIFQNDMNAESLLTQIIDARTSYSTKNNGNFAPSLSVLVKERFLQENAFSAVQKDGDSVIVQGFKFKQIGWTKSKWKVTAEPINPDEGTKRFTVDETENIISKDLGK